MPRCVAAATEDHAARRLQCAVRQRGARRILVARRALLRARQEEEREAEQQARDGAARRIQRVVRSVFARHQFYATVMGVVQVEARTMLTSLP